MSGQVYESDWWQQPPRNCYYILVRSPLLIYMSIYLEVEAHHKEGRLVRFVPIVCSPPQRRVIYVTLALKNLLDGPWVGDEWEIRWSRAKQQLDDFMDGLPRDRIFVRSAPRKKSACFMSLLDPENDEIWEIRCRDPKPGLRIFGSFIRQDVFVALTAAPHECLSSEGDWDRAIQQYKQEWNKYFSSAAFSGAYPNDYLTRAIVLD